MDIKEIKVLLHLIRKMTHMLLISLLDLLCSFSPAIRRAYIQTYILFQARLAQNMCYSWRLKRIERLIKIQVAYNYKLTFIPKYDL